MVKKIIHISDVHIPNSCDKRPFREMLGNLTKSIQDEIKDDNPDDVRIVIVGDIVDQKIKATNEAKSMMHEFFNSLDKMCKTYVVAGNHDMLENNTDRMDSLTPTFEIDGAYNNIVYCDRLLGYKSGFIHDDNITFALFSMHDSFASPGDIVSEKGNSDNSRVIGLYHGDVSGSVTDLGRVSEGGIDKVFFEGCDCVMAGHIHKRQTVMCGDVPLVYSGSVFQKDAGENITGHGFEVWDVDTMEHKHVEVPNDYRIFKFKIKSYDDVSEDKEVLSNDGENI